jgi:toxin ParE1/3/4
VNLKIIVTAPARLEIAQAVKYYEEQRPSAGVKFWIEFKVLAKRLKNFPEIYPRFGKRGIRKAPMHLYPHSVYYRITGEELRILGVVHGSINPEAIKARFA